MVERFVRDEEAVGSNPVTSTIKSSLQTAKIRGLQAAFLLIWDFRHLGLWLIFGDFDLNMGVKMGVKPRRPKEQKSPRGGGFIIRPYPSAAPTHQAAFSARERLCAPHFQSGKYIRCICRKPLSRF